MLNATSGISHNKMGFGWQERKRPSRFLTLDTIKIGKGEKKSPDAVPAFVVNHVDSRSSMLHVNRFKDMKFLVSKPHQELANELEGALNDPKANSIDIPEHRVRIFFDNSENKDVRRVTQLHDGYGQSWWARKPKKA